MLKKWILLFLVISSSLAFADRVDQEQKWQKKEKEVSLWVDGMGLGLDEEIKEGVIALNLLGFTTEQSCEGHLGWGREHPWIDFPIIEYPDLLDELSRLVSIRIDEENKLDHNLFYHPDFSNLPETYGFRVARDNVFDQLNKVDRANRKTDYEMLPYLQKFYQNHQSSYDAILIIDNNNLESRGASYQIFRTDSEKEQKLHLYQKEMKAFGAFLKEEFLSQ